MKVTLCYLSINTCLVPIHILLNVWIFLNVLITYEPSIIEVITCGLIFNLVNLIVFILFWLKKTSSKRANIINFSIHSVITISTYTFIGYLAL